MGMGRYVVDAVLIEGRSAREVAQAHGISRSWIYELLQRFRAGGYEALQPRSHRPRCPFPGRSRASWIAAEASPPDRRAEDEKGALFMTT